MAGLCWWLALATPAIADPSGTSLGLAVEPASRLCSTPTELLSWHRILCALAFLTWTIRISIIWGSIRIIRWNGMQDDVRKCRTKLYLIYIQNFTYDFVVQTHPFPSSNCMTSASANLDVQVAPWWYKGLQGVKVNRKLRAAEIGIFEKLGFSTVFDSPVADSVIVAFFN